MTVLWILAAILIGAGILIAFNPFQTLLMLLRVFGAALALYGIGEIVLRLGICKFRIAEIVTFFLFGSAK